MVIRQNKPRKTDKPTEHPSSIHEILKTKRWFGSILLVGIILVIILLLIVLIVSIVYNIRFFNQLTECIRIYWGAFSFGFACGLAIEKMLKTFRYFLNDND